MKVKTRFSPSPTGFLHIGGVRTALYSWLFARQNSGSFILRIEDTDDKRVNKDSVHDILSGLKNLELLWDEGPFYQSHRLKIYQDMIKYLLRKGKAYKCYCSPERLELLRNRQILKKEKPKYDQKCRNCHFSFKKSNVPYVIRFKNPNTGFVEFIDQVRGSVCVQNKELDDLILQRSNGMPTYNFCVIVDDWQMNITHVIRGEDHINNTSRQINLLRALDAPIPIYAHASMILDARGKKLSKRNHVMSVTKYFQEGFIPEAILNYILRLGWSYKDKEIFSIAEMIELFDLKSINRAPSVINEKKLLWLNHHYLKILPIEKVNSYFDLYLMRKNIILDKTIDTKSLLKNFLFHHNTFEEFLRLNYYFYTDIYPDDVKDIQLYVSVMNIKILTYLYKQFFLLKIWDTNNISLAIKQSALKFNLLFKDMAILLRISITGQKNTPNISSIVFYIGKRLVLSRINNCIRYMKHKLSV
ncbi:glutamate--tRNA ligase [Buchnera aphidicola]|uniref:glutamate--tRNA ligase n=1 Tax=Buchnera aphidicola TaxID=9 RepID=UPI00094C84DD|nr:glutamate--tRNA ligase [Buchnera aphidicola]